MDVETSVAESEGVDFPLSPSWQVWVSFWKLNAEQSSDFRHEKEQSSEDLEIENLNM